MLNAFDVQLSHRLLACVIFCVTRAQHNNSNTFKVPWQHNDELKYNTFSVHNNLRQIFVLISFRIKLPVIIWRQGIN